MAILDGEIFKMAILHFRASLPIFYYDTTP